MIKSNLRRLYLCAAFSLITLFNLHAEFNVIPQVDFGMLKLEEDTFLYSPSGCLQFKYQKEEDSGAKGPDVIAGSFSYGQDFFSKNVTDYSETHFHKLGLFGKVVFGKNTFLLKLDDRGAKPFESYKTFEGLLFYSRKLIDTDSTQLDFGGGLAATDTGIVLGGINLFVVPMPMIHFSYKNQIIDTEMEWIGMPDAIITFFPDKMFRIHTTFALAGFHLPTDIKGDIALCCYPFKDGFLKDLASISIGASHEVIKLRINTNSSLKYDYFTAYGQLSITALTVRGGYAFGGNLNHDGGFFLTLQAMYKF